MYGRRMLDCTLWCVRLVLFSRLGGVATGNLVELLPHIAHTVHQVLLDAGSYLAKILIQFWGEGGRDKEERGGEGRGGEGRGGEGRGGEGRGGEGRGGEGRGGEGRGGEGRGGERRAERREKRKS